MGFAIIMKSKVIDIIGIFPTNWQQFDEVVVAHSNVQPGDDYIMGNFYRDGTLILSPEQDMANALNILGVQA